MTRHFFNTEITQSFQAVLDIEASGHCPAMTLTLRTKLTKKPTKLPKQEELIPYKAQINEVS